jgi:hypothetical protein
LEHLIRTKATKKAELIAEQEENLIAKS